MVEIDFRDEVLAAARRARDVTDVLAGLSAGRKNEVLEAMADALGKRADEVLAANARDLAAGGEAGLAPGLVDRLALTEGRIAGMAEGLRVVAGLPDPVGEVTRGGRLANGLELRQVRVPLGVVGIVYEARPNVTVDAAGLTLKSGNAVLLRGSSTARRSNAALVAVLRDVLADHRLPADAVQSVSASDRETVRHLITARGLVDVVIPRGGAGLIAAVVENATVPTLETGVGNCHVYVDQAADLGMAVRIVVNSKTRRTSVCNAAETLLVHSAIAPEFIPLVIRELTGVTVRAEERFAEFAPGATVPATDEDWGTEYLSADLAARVVDSTEEAIRHIRQYGTGHTEAIVTDDLAAAREFTSRVDAAVVMVNAATSFTDGGEFGMGAEIGISTQKLHARGPMGLPELTSTKWIVHGDGHTRSPG